MKRYVKITSFEELLDIYKNNACSHYAMSEELLISLSKELNFSYNLYKKLEIVSEELSSLYLSEVLSTTSLNVTLLLDEDSESVLGYRLNLDRLPILNSEFLHRVASLVEGSELQITESFSEGTTSYVIIQGDPVSLILDGVEVSYKVGIFLVNNELDSTYSRLVLYIEDYPFYLPASYYNATSSRFKKTTNSPEEALDVLVLKILDDLRSENLFNKYIKFHYQYEKNKFSLVSYEEYRRVLHSLRKLSPVIEEPSLLENFDKISETFELKYKELDKKKNSYIWRCTAFSDLRWMELINLTTSVLKSIDLTRSVENFSETQELRELLGNFISTSCVEEEIAED